MYLLSINFSSGKFEEVRLEMPHELVPDNRDPKALVYKVGNITHNIPFSSMEKFWFDADLYNETKETMCKACIERTKNGKSHI